jgi:prostaglandin-endoperoxide synthase 2
MAEVQTNMLRSMEGGRLKSQMINGEEYPVHLFEKTESDEIQMKPEFEGLYTETNFKRVFAKASEEHKLNCFAVGLEHGNATMGNTSMNTLFLREHNRVAGVIDKAHNDWDDERVFQTARNVCIVLLIKIIIADYMKHICGGMSLFVDAGGFPEDEAWYRSNWMSIEFNLLYRWHDLIPDSVTLAGETMPSTALRQNNKTVVKLGLDHILKDASNQRAGSLGLENTPEFLLPITAISLNMARTCKIQPYVNYCTQYGIDPPTTFEELTGETEHAAKLKALYGAVERVEWFVGLFAQEHNSSLSSFSGTLMMLMVGNEAVTQALTNPLLAKRVYNEDTFSKEGFKIVESTDTLADLILRNTGIKKASEVGFPMDRGSRSNARGICTGDACSTD